MWKCKNKVGLVIGRLTVLARAPNKTDVRGRHRVQWKCKCSCGTIKVIPSDNLNCGSRKVTKSCGCLQSETTSIRTRGKPYENLYNHLIKGAKDRNIDVDITYTDYLIFTEEKNCHYCGDTLQWSKYGGPNIYMGHNLDRKDNTLGYTKENCAVCCSRCNRSKGYEFSYDEWRAIGRTIEQYRLDRSSRN